jgi:hypothetical protein
MTPHRTLTRFADVAYGGALRADGRLAAAGGEEGIVRVFEVRSRAVLRELGRTRAWVEPLDFFWGGGWMGVVLNCLADVLSEIAWCC